MRSLLAANGTSVQGFGNHTNHGEHRDRLTGKPGYGISFHFRRTSPEPIELCEVSSASSDTSFPNSEDPGGDEVEGGVSVFWATCLCCLVLDLPARLRLTSLRPMPAVLFRRRRERSRLPSHSLSNSDSVASFSITVSDRRFAGRTSGSSELPLRRTMLRFFLLNLILVLSTSRCDVWYSGVARQRYSNSFSDSIGSTGKGRQQDVSSTETIREVRESLGKCGV